MTEDHHYISHKTMVNLLNDLSPFNYAYFHGFFAIFFTSLILGSKFKNYQGITPFAQSMELASGRIRLLNDVVLLYFVLIFFIITLTYFMKGVSNKVVREFKLAAKNPDKLNHAVGENPKRTILITALILLFINIGWFMFFGFTSAGNSRIMRSFLVGSEYFIIINIFLGFLSNFYLLVYSLVMMEGRKHVVFSR
ncbi:MULTISPECIES: hypothetical protein [unclassified Psychrobacter]|uniref:hypothetical protein n=1 Tax=unclassified Psychrobacter TaxID=196806 RepID=UPI00070BA17C|nr:MULTISPECIES: hypothetical protein [unclassified Psychrobacter]KRG31925.1 hypothetical protein AK824_13340 [Psychrobacter sp. P11G3]MDX2375070.1 hypothetical protein [Psychrobacter sp. PP-21]